MEIRMLKARNLNEGIKRGMTIEDFCQKYQCSEEELRTQIENLYSHNSSKAKEYMDQIEANSKKARPKKTDPENQAEVVDDASTDETENTDIELTAEPTPSVETVISGHVAELEELQRFEESLSREVMDLEANHNTYASMHKGCLARLRDLRDEIEQIEKEYEAKCEASDLVIQENNAYVEQMNDISTKLCERRAVLDETRQKIAGLNKLIMFVYSGGEIYINDSRIDEEIALDEKLYNELRDKPECDELRQREIKVLTKMITFARSSTIVVEVTCESEDLEIAYLELV